MMIHRKTLIAVVSFLAATVGAYLEGSEGLSDQAALAAGKPAQSTQAKKPVYTPPMRGAPTRRVGGATRGAGDDDIFVTVLAPEGTGLTNRESPTLYWYVSRAPTRQVTFPGENRFALTVTSISADGGLVLFICREQYPEEGLGPCNKSRPDAPFTWYLLDTETGERIQLPHVMEFRSLSPDGSMLLGETEDGLALASVSSLRSASVTALSDDRPLGVANGSATWSPDSASIIVRSAAGTSLVRADGSETVQLLPEAVVRGIAWAPDGSKVALVLPPEESTSPDSPSGIFVFDGDGNQLWHRPAEGEVPNPRWSADGERLAVQMRVVYQQEPNVFRLDVFDGDTGEPLYRIPGAIACGGPIWTADGSRLVVGSYGLGSFVGDPSAGTFRRLEMGATPSLTNPNQGVGYDGFDFYRVDLSTGEFTLLAETTVEPAWYGDHEPLFVGERIVFTAPHGGHGGCSVCCGLENPPEPAFQYPPFDD